MSLDGRRTGQDPEASVIKITDRRRFTPEGTVRAGNEAALAENRRRPVEDLARASGPEPVSSGPSSHPAAAPAAAPSSPPRAPAQPKSEVDFMAFVASLATTAMASLGLLPETQDQGLAFNPPMAREYIEIIAMLEERTAGNLSSEEAQSLRRLIRDLRLQYVEATRPPHGP